MSFLKLLKLNIPVVKRAFKSAGIQGSPDWSSHLLHPQTPPIRHAELCGHPARLVQAHPAFHAVPARASHGYSLPSFSYNPAATTTATATRPEPVTAQPSTTGESWWSSYSRSKLQAAEETILNYLDDFRM